MATLGLPCSRRNCGRPARNSSGPRPGTLPELVTEHDILGDLHMHTTETDGLASLEEMAEAARRADSSTSRSPIIRNASPWPAVWTRRACCGNGRRSTSSTPTSGRDFRVLKGIEVDILEKGGLDLPDDVLAQADWVVASVHYGQKQPREQITARIVDALANPNVQRSRIPPAG